MHKIIYFLVVFYSLNYSSVDSVIVTTSLGQLRGNEVFIAEKNKTISVFQGIPYAKPPTGDLRFRPAQPASNWSGVWDGTHPRTACMQPNEPNASEDCLFLNVYVPHNQFDDQTTKLNKSIMFWIHGGGFVAGSIIDPGFNASYLSALGDVIVFEVNYRLSAFGFLFTDSSESPGNQAFTDSLLALEFVQKNAKFFGGNPNSVTIFGESAGSMTVSALLLIENRNLFNRAIMQSGSVDSYLGSEPKESALIKATAFAKQMQCFDNKTNKIDVLCLRKVDPKLIVAYIEKQTSSGVFFSPIFGDILLPIKPSIAIKNGNFSKNVQLLFGTCRDEGAGFVSDGIIPDLNPDTANSTMNLGKAQLLIDLLFNAMHISYAKQVSDFYTTGLTDADGFELKHAIADSFGDFHLTCPTMKLGSRMSVLSNAYAYRLTFTTKDPHKDWTGVAHADDLKYVFGAPLEHPEKFILAERQLSLDMTQIWTTFAKTGKPPKLNGKEWPEAIDKTLIDPSVRYMQLDPKNYTIVENAYKKSCDGFWKSHLNQTQVFGHSFNLSIFSPLYEK